MDDSLDISHDQTNSTNVHASQTDDGATTRTTKKKRKRIPKPHVKSQLTIRNPPWQYIHLQHLNSNKSSSTLDAVTAHLHLTAALSQFLGLHGAAIPIDILKVDGDEVWIRIPQEDRNVLSAAVGGWVSSKGEGWRVKGTSSWDARALPPRDGGQDLFI